MGRIAAVVAGLLVVALEVGEPVGFMLRGAVLAGAFASFLASTIALRERLGALDRTGGGDIGYDLTLWAGVFAIAALASLRPMDPWFLALVGLGAAASTLGPVTLWSRRAPGVALTAELVGLVLFATLAIVAQWRGDGAGLIGASLAHPALVAVPAGALVLWIGGLGARR